MKRKAPWDSVLYMIGSDAYKEMELDGGSGVGVTKKFPRYRNEYLIWGEVNIISQTFTKYPKLSLRISIFAVKTWICYYFLTIFMILISKHSMSWCKFVKNTNF